MGWAGSEVELGPYCVSFARMLIHSHDSEASQMTAGNGLYLVPENYQTHRKTGKGKMYHRFSNSRVTAKINLNHSS